MRLRSLTVEALKGEGVDPLFAAVLTNPERYHKKLSILIEPIDWDYYVPSDVTQVVPLWSSNADSVVRWTRDSKTEFVLLHHDDPEWTLLAISEQGAKAELWRQWIEFRDADAKECKRFAEAIGFTEWQAALKLLDNDFGKFKKWKLELTGR